jgi:hypothetical protein
MKKQSFQDYHLGNEFHPLTIKSFSCLHKQINDVLHPCANNGAWDMKSLIGLSLDPNPFPQTCVIILQKMQASTILSSQKIGNVATS